MSLVNTSLQNLEARRGEEPLANYAAASVRLGNQQHNRGHRKSLFAGCILGAAAAAIYFLQSGQATIPASDKTLQAAAAERPASDKGNSASKPFEPASPVENLSGGKAFSEETALSGEKALSDTKTFSDLKAFSHVKEIGTNTDNSPATAATQQPPPIQPGLINSTITLLLQSAQDAIQDDRLSLPENNNAVSYYRQVLLLQADHPQALAGLEQVADRYRELAEQQLAEKQFEPAIRFAEQGLALSPDNPQLAVLSARIRSQQAAAPESDSNDDIKATKKITPANPLTVAHSGTYIDQQQAADAQQKADSGDITGAIADLQQLADSGTIGKQATQLLARLYLSQNQPEAIEQLLAQQALLSEAEAAYLIARAQVQTKNLAAALATLEAQSPPMSTHPDYYALLAGVYQQGRQYQAAAGIYQQLARLQPQTYTHWLGLAAALDGLKKPEARAVFQRVLPMIPAGQANLKHYVQQRLEQLSTQPGN